MQIKITTLSRLLLGLIFLVFGLNKFYHFIPMPPSPEAAKAFFSAMAATGYFVPLLAITETVVGVMLITGLAAPLALLILAPITLQILFFQIYLAPGVQNLILPTLVLVLHLVTATKYWPLYRPLFGKR